MAHTCIGCAEDDEVELEVHVCKNCHETYCVHFMKAIGKDALCWVCGSEKKKKEG